MGYELHITRKQEWDENGPEISLAEWIAVVEADQDMRLGGFAEHRYPDGRVLRTEDESLAVWTAYSGHREDGNKAWFRLWRGNVIVKSPDIEIVQKTWSLA